MPSATLDVLDELAQVVTAGHRLDPGVGDADERLGQIGVGEPNRLEHRSRAGSVAPIRDGRAVPLQTRRTAVLRPTRTVHAAHSNSPSLVVVNSGMLSAGVDDDLPRAPTSARSPHRAANIPS
jgi:hypothetical protein